MTQPKIWKWEAAEEITECLSEKLSRTLICSVTILGLLCPQLLKYGFEYLGEILENQREQNEFKGCQAATYQDTSIGQKIASKVCWKQKQVALVLCLIWQIDQLKFHI